MTPTTAKTRTSKTRAAQKSAAPGRRGRPRTAVAPSPQATPQSPTLAQARRAVTAYLLSLEARSKRGRPLMSLDRLETLLAEAERRRRVAVGMDRLVAIQRCHELRDRIEAARAAANGTDERERAEAAFVAAAKVVADAEGISYGAFRDAGVSAAVVKAAGISR